MKRPLSHPTLVTALGRRQDEHINALLKGKSGLEPCHFEGNVLPTWAGCVDGLNPVRSDLSIYDCRSQRLAEAALQQHDFQEAVARAVHQYGADRVGVVVGTTSSGARAGELAYQQRDPITGQLQQDFCYKTTVLYSAISDFVQAYLGLTGLSLSVGSACAASAIALGVADRWCRAGWCDAVVIGGVESLCLTTLYGFSSLQLLSTEPCRPFDTARDGLSLGEAAGFVLMEARNPKARVGLLGYGERVDAYHISRPHPAGQGALAAMKSALTMAELSASSVDYVHCHGTASLFNDEAEDRALYELFKGEVPCASTKGWVGHTLGAAGIVGVIFSMLMIEHGFLLKSLNTQQVDPSIQSTVLLETQQRKVNTVMTNAFGFGGHNSSLIIGAIH